MYGSEWLLLNRGELTGKTDLRNLLCIVDLGLVFTSYEYEKTDRYHRSISNGVIFTPN